jgi:hypothetical protein
VPCGPLARPPARSFDAPCPRQAIGGHVLCRLPHSADDFFVRILSNSAMVFSSSKSKEQRVDKKKKSLTRFSLLPPTLSTQLTQAGATSTVLEAEDLTSGERRALKVRDLEGSGWRESERRKEQKSLCREQAGKDALSSSPSKLPVDRLFWRESWPLLRAWRSPSSPLLPLPPSR